MVLPTGASLVYYPALADAREQVAMEVIAGAGRVDLHPPRRWALEDFDGDTIASGAYGAAWLPLAPAAGEAFLTDGGPVLLARTVIRRYAAAGIAAPERVRSYPEDGGTPELMVRVREAAWPDRPRGVSDARVMAIRGSDSVALPSRGAGEYAAALPASPGGGTWRVEAHRPGWWIPPADVELQHAAGWGVAGPGSLETPMASPVNLRVRVARDRGLDDARVTARVAGREVPLRPLADGGYTVNLDGLRPGLHVAEVVAERPGEPARVDTVRVYARASGWVKVPRRLEVQAGRSFTLEASVRSRMGERLSGYRLPLVAVTGARVVRLEEAGDSGLYRAEVPGLPRGQHRVYVTSLEGDFQRRVVVVEAR
jgi:hypothetical protein